MMQPDTLFPDAFFYSLSLGMMSQDMRHNGTRDRDQRITCHPSCDRVSFSHTILRVDGTFG